MVKTCCIKGCKKKKGDVMFTFPKEETLRKMWIDKCQNYFRQFRYNKKHAFYICEKHFSKADIKRHSSRITTRTNTTLTTYTRRTRLCDNVVPMFLRKSNVFKNKTQGCRTAVDPLIFEHSYSSPNPILAAACADLPENETPGCREAANLSILDHSYSSPSQHFDIKAPELVVSDPTKNSDMDNVDLSGSRTSEHRADSSMISKHNSSNVFTGETTENTMKHAAFDEILSHVRLQGAPEGWQYFESEEKIILHYCNWKDSSIHVKIEPDLTTTVMKGEAVMTLQLAIESFEEFKEYLDRWKSATVCQGLAAALSRRHESCLRLFQKSKDGRTLSSGEQCEYCNSERRRLYRNAFKKLNRSTSKEEKNKNKTIEMKRTIRDLQNKVVTLETEIEAVKQQFGKFDNKRVEEVIALLPKSQQEQVRNCFKTASLKDKRGMRYNAEWLYECLLLRGKSKEAYEHLRENNILSLPTIETLRSYSFHSS